MAFEELAAKIKASANLHDLLRNLVAFEAAVKSDERDIDTEGMMMHNGIDLAQLPTFGGVEPRNTDSLWSYDEDRVLVGEGPFTEWEIFDRDDESQAWRN